MSTSTEPWYVPQARIAKADRLTRALTARGVTADVVVRFTDTERREVEKAAAIRRGSGDTWRLVVEMLAGSARRDALCTTCGHGNPDGVPGPPQMYGHPGPCAQ